MPEREREYSVEKKSAAAAAGNAPIDGYKYLEVRGQPREEGGVRPEVGAPDAGGHLAHFAV